MGTSREECLLTVFYLHCHSKRKQQKGVAYIPAGICQSSFKEILLISTSSIENTS